VIGAIVSLVIIGYVTILNNERGEASESVPVAEKGGQVRTLGGAKSVKGLGGGIPELVQDGRITIMISLALLLEKR
jgi:hypothetical protein